MRASRSPLTDLLNIGAHQAPELRNYTGGYESFMERLPEVYPWEDWKEPIFASVLSELHNTLLQNSLPVNPGKTKFTREILAIQDNDMSVQGAEILMANWGEGHTSPVHGHASGFMFESLLKGKLRVTTYKQVSETTARPYKVEIVKPGVFVSQYSGQKTTKHPRPYLIHSFEALEHSVSLHFLSEHSRDGSDNGFKVERFEEFVTLDPQMFTRISSKEGMYLKPGEVVLVRSSNVPEYLDHWIVVTGSPVMKEHGMRVQDHSVPSTASKLLDIYDDQRLVLLKAKPFLTSLFLNFHKIELPKK